MRRWAIRLGRWEINLAWEELYTEGKPISHQAYGLYITDGRETEPRIVWHCKPA